MALVLIAHLDESYTASRYFIAAAIGDEQQWDEVHRSLADIRSRTAAEHGVAADAEFHTYEIMSGRGAWKVLRGKHREANGIISAVIGAARKAEIKLILRGVNVTRLNSRYSYPQPPHAIVLGHTLERIEDYARHRRQTEPVLVIADEIAEQAEHQRAVLQYQQRGTPGYRSSKLERIAAPIRFESSAGNSGLQIADAVAYIHRRRETQPERHPLAQEAMARLSEQVNKMTSHSLTWEP